MVSLSWKRSISVNKKIEKILEFDKITGGLAKETVTALGKNLALQLKPMTEPEKIEAALTDIDEMQSIDEAQRSLPLGQLVDVGPLMKRLDIGGILNGQELAHVGRVLKSVSEVSHFFKEIEDLDLAVEQMQGYVSDFANHKDLAKKINQAIASDGSVYDEASSHLHSIRQSIKAEEAHIRMSLDNIIKSSQADYLSDQIVTIRNDRYVLPVKQEYRRKFGGVVHDQSASGQTLYIEPQVVMESNNKVHSLRIEEQAEIERIFAELSANLSPHSQEINQNNQILGQLDFIQAKWRYAKKQGAHRPLIAQDHQSLNLEEAVHPLLNPKTAVDNTISFNGDYRMLIITGPNTGGKTITLKTTGLLQLMGQSGLYITAKADSRIGVFDRIFADIGDEQSIEANLSTFSGHMTNIIAILEAIDDQSLVLIDELGSGTDPKEGAALAMAILNRLAQVGCTVLATTHYPELKAYAFEEPNAINASVEFDEKTLTPTYRLLIGQPGRSNAFDISQRLGLDQGIVDEARYYVGEESQSLNEMIDDLDEKRQAYERDNQALSHDLLEADKLLTDLKKAYQALENDKITYLNRAKREANDLVAKTQEKADKLLGDIREWQKNNPQGQNVKEHEMIDKQKQISNLTQEEEQLKKNKVLKRQKRKKHKSLEVGDEVKVIPYSQMGTLVEEREDRHWLVQMGMLKMEIPEKDLELQEKSQPKSKGKKGSSSVRASQSKNIKSELDLRGMRYEEAMTALDRYIDQALLANYPQVTIIHGFGTGVIRDGVQKYLRNNKRVKSFSYAPHNLGGQGATIVKFGD